MYNRRTLISESERERILGLHGHAKKKEWGEIYEQAAPSRKEVRQNFREYEKTKGDIQSQMNKIYRQMERQGQKINLPQKEAFEKELNRLKAEMNSLDVKFGYKPSADMVAAAASADTASATAVSTTADTSTTAATTASTTADTTTTAATTAAPTTKEEIMAFQDWLDTKFPQGWASSTKYPGYYYRVDKKPGLGYGTYGKNTTAMWTKYGADYSKEKGGTATGTATA
jgi:hypothetical protein